MRTAFQRDRDRIIHCNAFRRLKHKTQVFIAPLGDHYVTRLTHTLEVAQIARSISRSLNLNEDLTEAIALAHDLGHTPFGHVGEEVLDEISESGFRHNEQSLRVVEFLEKGGRGLNLTWEVREGILMHSKSRVEVLGDDWETSETLEGQVCKIADVAAYVNHDINDALRASLVREAALPAHAVSVLGRTRSQRINTIVRDVVDCSWPARGEGLTDQTGKPMIVMSPTVSDAMNSLRGFLFENAYHSELVEKQAEQARVTVHRLYNYFFEHEDRIPWNELLGDVPLSRKVIDYIAGMTDQYALQVAQQASLV